MSFAVSPGVTVKEHSVSTIVPAVDSSQAGYAGVFRWGPVGEVVIVDSEGTLVERFGRPTNFNAEGWFSAASFTAYSDKLLVVRAAEIGGGNTVLSAVANSANVTNLVGQIVKNEGDYVNKTFAAGVHYVARFPGAMGNSLRVSQVDTAEQFQSTINLAAVGTGAVLTMEVGSNVGVLEITASSNTLATQAAAVFVSSLGDRDMIQVGNTFTGVQSIRVVNTVTEAIVNDSEITVTINFDEPLKLHSDVMMTTDLVRTWEFADLVNGAPGTSDWAAAHGSSIVDETHVVVVDDGGKFTGVPGTILEVYQGLSRASDAKLYDNSTNFIKDRIANQSQYVWVGNARTGAAFADLENLANASTTEPFVQRFAGGSDGADEANVSIAALADAWDKFKDPTKVTDMGLIITGKSRGGTLGGQMANYLIDNIAEVRKDGIVFVSPAREAVVDNIGSEAAACVAFRNTLRSTSYGFLDSGYKYMYDRYNDVYRYVPLCGDMAGLAARTDATNDAWWSPAGFNRGHVKNLVRLSWNPSKAERDILYKNAVNPVVSFEGMGTILYGDKTLLAKPDAFDRINVRRLFIVLEKAISRAAQYSLFEFNDEFTRAQFRNMVNPYLRDIKGRRGITDFMVVCDERNNTGVVIDRNEFIGDIYIKPARSINWITLNFVAVGTSVNFSEVIGQFS